jgi:hypothetical protein
VVTADAAPDAVDSNERRTTAERERQLDLIFDRRDVEKQLLVDESRRKFLEVGSKVFLLMHVLDGLLYVVFDLN